MTSPAFRRASELARNLPDRMGRAHAHLKRLSFFVEYVVAANGTKQFSRR